MRVEGLECCLGSEAQGLGDWVLMGCAGLLKNTDADLVRGRGIGCEFGGLKVDAFCSWRSLAVPGFAGRLTGTCLMVEGLG